MPSEYEKICLEIGFPRAIHTKTDYETAIELTREMAGRKLTADQREYRLAVVKNIKEYENGRLEHLDVSGVTGVDVLKLIMHSGEITQTQIAEIINKDASIVSKILHGHRKIQPTEAREIAQKFSLDPITLLI